MAGTLVESEGEQFRGGVQLHPRPVHDGRCCDNDIPDEDIDCTRMRISYVVGIVVGIVILLIVFIVSVVGWKLFKRDFN